MTQGNLPLIDAPQIDFDIERDTNWPLPPACAWDSARKPSLWQRWQNFVDDVLFGDFGDE